MRLQMTSFDTPPAPAACAEAGHIRHEYDEMPGLVLTTPQICRMFRLDSPTCDTVMDGFVTEGLLVRLPGGSYANRLARE
jgi:hypothetical protein